MPGRAVHFDANELYTGNRPVVDLVLCGPGGPQGHTSFPIAAALAKADVTAHTGEETLMDAAAKHVGAVL